MGNQISKCVVWAVDPFAKDFIFQKTAVTAIKHLGAEKGLPVIPIYIWRETKVVGLQSGISALNLKRHHELGQKRIDLLTEGEDVEFKSLQIIAKPLISLREGAEHLIQKSKKLNADMIVLSTHARKGLENWFVGSFAETLSFISDVPLLIAQPHWKLRSTDRRVLFLTDFSQESYTAFEELVETAKIRNWSITLFHQLKMEFYPTGEIAFAAWEVYQDTFREEEHQKRFLAHQLVEIGGRRGVKVEVLIDTEHAGSVDTIALNLLNSNHLMVALASRSTFLQRAFLGSTTRQLIRNSPVPVWVIHPNMEKNLEARRKLQAVSRDIHHSLKGDTHI